MKKLLSIILSLCLLFSITAGIDFSAQAATNITAKTKVDSICATAGYRPGVDNYNDCYAYASAFCNAMYGSAPGGTSGYTLTRPGNFYLVGQVTGSSVTATSLANLLSQAMPGDVVQMHWNYGTGQGQHTAIVYSADSSSFTVLQDGASWSTIQKSTYNYSSSYSKWSGGSHGISLYRHKNYSSLFPSGSTGETITPTISDDKNYVVVGENITFTYSGLSVCSKACFFFEKDGDVYYSYDSTSSKTFTTYFEKSGVYYVFSGGYINGNWYYSDKIRVDVFEPKLVANKNTVNQKELLTFTYSGLTSCGRVTICFEKDGKVYYTDDVTANVDYKTYFENTGVYYVYVVGYISNYSCKSNKIKVTVNCSHQTTVTIPSVKPTCVNAGKSEGKKCSECGTVLTYQSTISATGHKYTNSCDATCNTCGATRTISHKYDSGKVTKQATCTSTGIMTYTCTVCGATKSSTIFAKSHSYDYGRVTWPATCTEEGMMTYTCTSCGTTKVETIPATGHTIVTDKAVKATYAKAGKTEGSHCSVCGEIIVAQKTVAKLTVPKITLNSVKSSKSKQITVAWTKNTKVTGYEIQYSTDKNFKKGNKTVTVSKNSTTSTTIKKLTGKKKYYVRIRAYKTESGKKYYSAWSASKSVTTKK